MNSKALFASFTFLFLLASSLPGFAPLGEKWTKNRTVTIHLSFTGPSFPLSDGFTSWDQSATDVLNIWNTHLVHMKFAVDHNSRLSPAENDADNSAFFSNSVYGDAWGSSGVLAITLLHSRNGVITETDVIFNSLNFNWDSYRGPLRSGAMDFHRVALHEFGHVVGLGHPDQSGQSVSAIMNSRVSNLDSLQSDDIAGAQNLYGTGPPFLGGNPSTNLINISTRGRIDTGAKVLIGGFIIQGSDAATVILRSVGHSLAAHGIANAISDPTIALHDSNGTMLASNDDWISSPDAQTIASYRLDPPNSIESALYVTLNPGRYTALVEGYEDSNTPAATGVGLFELYDLHLTNNSRAGNLSTRGQVLTGSQVMIGGFIISGGVPKDVVIRALGPSLANQGVNGALSDPTLELRDGSGALIDSNDDWEQDANAVALTAAGLAPSNAKESALRRTLNAGSYTAIVRGVGGTGLGLVEVYDLSAAP